LCYQYINIYSNGSSISSNNRRTWAFQGIKGMAEKKQGKDELNDYDRQDLTNAYENRPISTMGSDYLAEQSQLLILI
jgi:hypothetical protein